MRLTLTLPELEQGYSIQNGIRERITELKFTAERKEPVAITPIVDHERRIISSVLLTEYLDLGRDTSLQIKFRPVWCKTFTVCSYNKDSLQAVVVELPNGQFWVDQDGCRPCDMTLNGSGTDPHVVHHSQFILGDLLVERPRPRLLHNLINLIQKSC